MQNKLRYPRHHQLKTVVFSQLKEFVHLTQIGGLTSHTTQIVYTQINSKTLSEMQVLIIKAGYIQYRYINKQQSRATKVISTFASCQGLNSGYTSLVCGPFRTFYHFPTLEENIMKKPASPTV